MRLAVRRPPTSPVGKIAALAFTSVAKGKLQFAQRLGLHQLVASQCRAVSCFKNTHNWLMSMQATSALIVEARENCK